MALPLGVRFARSGAVVTLLDRDIDRVNHIRAGRASFRESGLDDELRNVTKGGALTATTNLPDLADQHAVILAIGTPLDEWLNPDVGEFHRACGEVVATMHDGQLLILRSTVVPGTTERVGEDAAARGLQLQVAYCPDRCAEGAGLSELSKHPQLVAGTTSRATRAAGQLFRRIGTSIIELKPKEAELGKLFTNAYRYIHFAVANQFFMAADRLGVDFYEVHRAITRDYPRMAGFPRGGFAAGPCLPKDTLQLAAFDLASSPMGLAAMAINEGLPKVLVEQAKARFNLATMTTGILGMAFKGKSDDPRGSLAYKLRKVLSLESRQVLCTDPYIGDPDFVSLDRVLAEADVLFVGACHPDYDRLRFRHPVIDCFGTIRSDATALRLVA